MKKFEPNNYVYHYTSLESASKIIKSRILKFGILPRMNDISEVSKEYYLDGALDTVDWNILTLLENKVGNIRQLSFSIDDMFLGFAINSMWGHYAECGEGCCIVLDKDKIINQCNELGLIYGKVKYDNAIKEVILPENLDVEAYLEENSNDLFFHKSKDWEHEQEFRVINLNVDKNNLEGLSINNCIRAVILHTNCKSSVFDCSIKQKYIEQIESIGIPVLEYVYSSMWSQDNKGPMLIDKYGNDLLNNHQND